VRRWLVYVHEHRTTGKKYIGITGQKPDKRWKNGLGYQGSPYFWAAIQKHGWDAFRHEILFSGLTQKEAETKEVELIAKYKTTQREYGYNAAAGGNTTTGCKISEEGRRNISAAHVGHKHTSATREKMSASRKGEGNHFHGKHHTREAILANVKAHGGRSVLCVETGKVFVSLGEAERQTGINRYQISGCCRNRQSCLSAGGYHWRFTDNTNTAREEEKDDG
jgi:group I intron endonuclease